VRSRAARSVDGRVRFALSVPLVGSDGFEFQHVALATDDVLAAARAMRDRGVPLLEIPDNYYDDLRSRSRLEADTVEAMRDLGVLYDATGDGELLHVSTEMVGPGIFVGRGRRPRGRRLRRGLTDRVRRRQRCGSLTRREEPGSDRVPPDSEPRPGSAAKPIAKR
jgi:4-hydroxyphenylpyruvate dioxygenase-like putative hemolysin